MIYASLRSFKSWALLIPGLIIYNLVTTWSIWLETAFLVYHHLQLPVLPCGFSSRPSVVENLTGRTPRFTHFHASLRSFKSGSLGIPGHIIYTLVITWSIWLETAPFVHYHLQLPMCPGCGFYTPLRGFKTLRQELSDALWFIRRFTPLNHEPCLSQALWGIP